MSNGAVHEKEFGAINNTNWRRWCETRSYAGKTPLFLLRTAKAHGHHRGDTSQSEHGDEINAYHFTTTASGTREEKKRAGCEPPCASDGDDEWFESKSKAHVAILSVSNAVQTTTRSVSNAHVSRRSENTSHQPHKDSRTRCPVCRKMRRRTPGSRSSP